MSLTVPTAGLTAGRAAEVRYEAPETGNVIAAFGQRVKQLGDRLETDRLDVEASRLQLDMTRDLNQLRLKYEQMGDPEAIDQGWARDIAAIRDGYLNGQTETGRPRVDPKLRDRWSLMFDDLAEKHAFAIGTNVAAIRRSQRVANVVEYEATVAQAAANADPATRGTLYEQLDRTYDGLVASGDWSPEQAAEAKLKSRQNGDFNAFYNDLLKNAEGAAAMLSAGAYAEMSPEDGARAKTLLASASERARLAGDKVRADAMAVVKADLSDGIKLARQGLTSAAEGLIGKPEITAEFPELMEEFRGMVALRNAGVVIQSMTLDQLRAVEVDWAKETFAREWQAEGLKAVRTRIAEVTEKGRADPVALWKGSDALGLQDIDFATPETMVAGLAQRATDIKRLTESGHLKPGNLPLDADEAAHIRDMLAVEKDPAARIDTALALIGSLGRDPAARVINDETLSGVASMLSSGAGNKVMARQILAGQRIAAEKGLPLPSEGSWKEVVGANFGSLFADGTIDGLGDENPALRQLGSMAFGLYTYRRGQNADMAAETLDQDLLMQSFHEVAGGTGTFGTSGSTGGVGIVKDGFVFLPPGVSGEAVEGALMYVRQSALFAGNAADVDADDTWRRISASANVPRAGGQPVDLDTFERLRLREAGNGRYNLIWTDGTGRSVRLDGDDGKAYVLDLYALLDLAEARQ